LKHQHLVCDLKPIPIDPESAVDCVVANLQDRVAELPAVQRPGAPDGLDENLAAPIPGSGPSLPKSQEIIFYCA
jgi:hypothetical protein